MKNVVILSHKNCSDGFAAAWAAHHYYSSQQEPYHLKHIYVDPPNPELAFEKLQRYLPPNKVEEVYSFDVGYKADKLLKLLEIYPDAKVYDHHISSYKDICANIDPVPVNYHFNNDKSGATLAWECFFKDQPVPKLLQYIEDRDLWNFRRPDSIDITAGIYASLPIGDFDMWTEFVENEEEKVVEMLRIGKIINKLQERRIRALIRIGKVYQINGLKAFVVNTTENVSDLGNTVCQLKDENNNFIADYAMIYRHDHKEDETYVSLRSNQGRDVDVSKIAESFSSKGGGHKNAAGFVCQNIFELLSIEKLSE